MRDVPRRVIVTLLRAYKLLFSFLYTGSCRYVPSCSEYASLAVQEHGATRGSWLAVRRLARCHPFGGSGLDPVPSRAPAVTGAAGQPASGIPTHGT